MFKIRRTKNSLSVWHTCTAGGCGETENLTVPEPFEPGTEAIRQEFLINSRLSASQTPGLKPCVCPDPSGPGTLRFSRLPADARRTRMPHAQGVFLFSGAETEHTILTARKKHGKMSKIQKLSEKWSRDRGKKYEV